MWWTAGICLENEKKGETMQLSMAYFFDENNAKIDIAKQLNVPYVVTNCSHKGDEVPKEGWDFAPFIEKVHRFEDEGLKVEVVESPTPLERVKLGIEGWERETEAFLQLIELLDKLDIHTICYNWMPVIGWFRSRKNIKTRGGAVVTGFFEEDMRGMPLTDAGVVQASKLWDTLQRFLETVVPECEKHHVKLALHPDDPPVRSLRGIDRILISRDAFDKVFRLVNSKANGMTLCQGSFSAMGESPSEMIRYFGKKEKIFFAHFRDIRGSSSAFTETFHDDGQTNMLECMKAYHEIAFKGCIRPDHVPGMVGEKVEHSGYSNLGNLYALGYMRGLMEATGQ